MRYFNDAEPEIVVEYNNYRDEHGNLYIGAYVERLKLWRWWLGRLWL
ncbi:MAG: hypothetical protein PHW65_04585 [Dehalococcoidales bacterium]|nr:hypothetical protein [Dehalococcoidales bacterium]